MAESSHSPGLGPQSQLSDYVKSQRTGSQCLSFHVHGVDLEVYTALEGVAQSLRNLMGFAVTEDSTVSNPLTITVVEESPEAPSVLDVFDGAELVLA